MMTLDDARILLEDAGENASAALAGLASDTVCWRELVSGSSLESVASFVKTCLAALQMAARSELSEDRDACLSILSMFLGEAASSIAPAHVAIGTAIAFGSFLSGLGGGANALQQNAKGSLFSACHLWFESGGLAAAVTACVCRGQEVAEEAVSSCIQLLCNFVDLASPLSTGFRGAMSSAWLDAYPTVLVANTVEAWHGQFHNQTRNRFAPRLMVRLAVRGEAAMVAAHLCASCMRCREAGEAKLSSFGAEVLQQIAEENAAAACNVVDAILLASGALLTAENGGLQGQSDVALSLLFSMLRPLLTNGGGPVHHLLSDRIWRRNLGAQLPAPVLFNVVDLLKTLPDWAEIRLRWSQRWADAAMLKRADLPAERALALRLARALCSTVDDDVGDMFGPALHLLLQGVHIRLSAQVEQSRWYGMAVAEIMARQWPKGDGDDVADLHFDGFDLEACGLSIFSCAGVHFTVAQASPNCEPGTPGALLQELLHRAAQSQENGEAGEDAPREKTLALDKHTGVVDNMEHTGAVVIRGFKVPDHSPVKVEAAGTTSSAVDDVDSDDEDDPLSNLPALPALQTAEDNCTDLLLVQPPRYLRSAYEMLMGPPKEHMQAVGSTSGQANAGSPEQPAAARARVVTSLAALPALIRAAAPDLASLAEQLCSRLLHIGDTAGLEDLVQQRRDVLVSLLVMESSRHKALRALIANVGAEDLQLANRLLILNILSDAAKELSNSADSTEKHQNSAKDERVSRCLPGAGKDRSPLTAESKTRRFASATRVPLSKPNRFAAELRSFLFPLIARWQRPDAGAGRCAASDPMFIGALLHCTGVLLECGGRASADRDSAVSALLPLVEEFWSHHEARVRRCSAFLLSRILLVGGEEAVIAHPLLLDRVEATLLQDGDEMCRKMAQGIVAWLDQHCSIPESLWS